MARPNEKKGKYAWFYSWILWDCVARKVVIKLVEIFTTWIWWDQKQNLKNQKLSSMLNIY